MESTINFTKDSLKNLDIRSKQYSVLDKGVPHLRVYVYPSGVKTFMLYRKVNDKPQRLKIGRVSELTIEQARKEAARLNSLIALGQDPLRDKQDYRNAITFKELYEYYFEHHAKQFNKGALEYRKAVERSILPQFGKMKACDISADKLRSFHAELAKTTSNSNANWILALTSAVFNFCINNSFYQGDNPCSKVKKFKTVSRDRFLSREELLKFFDAVKQEEQLFEHFFLMLLYTGARKSNVLSMKWQDINFEMREWRLNQSETKNKEVNIIHLTDQAFQILLLRANENKQSNQSQYVFRGSGSKGHLNDPKKAFERVKERMGIENFRMHDLRRTLASYMAIGGTSLTIIGKALNHKSHVSTSIYARLSEEPVKQAMNIAIASIKDVGHVSLFQRNKTLYVQSAQYLRFNELV